MFNFFKNSPKYISWMFYKNDFNLYFIYLQVTHEIKEDSKCHNSLVLTWCSHAS